MRFFLFFCLLGNLCAAVEPKIYSESDLKKKINEEVSKKLFKVKGRAVTEIITEILNKENDLEIRENKLREERAQLAVSMESFEKRVKAHLEKQKDFLGCIDTVKGEEDKRVTQMVEIISTMKADKAAQVLSIQDQELTIKILGLLDSRTVSKIFNLMDKEISARLQKQFMTMKR